jgi:threonine/homoserine/homoserine lactone efflux protein
MPDDSSLALFLVAVLALNLTPGPDMLFCFANGVGRGRAAGAVAALGIGAGSVVHTLAAALGAAGLLAASPLLFDAVRFAGAAYLFWLAWRALSAPLSAAGAAGAGVEAAGRSGLGRVFLQGLVTNVLNPKVALFFIAFLPQFAVPADGPVWQQMLLLGGVLSVSGTLVNAAVGVGAGGLGGLFGRNPRIARVQRWLTAGIFAGLAARLALTGGRTA